MNDLMVKLALLVLRPVEKWHEWTIRRAYRSGKYRYHPTQGKPCITTRRKS